MIMLVNHHLGFGNKKSPGVFWVHGFVSPRGLRRWGCREKFFTTTRGRLLFFPLAHRGKVGVMGRGACGLTPRVPQAGMPSLLGRGGNGLGGLAGGFEGSSGPLWYVWWGGKLLGNVLFVSPRSKTIETVPGFGGQRSP